MSAANPDRSIKVGDKTYTLRLSVRAMIALQDHYGLKSMTEVGQHLEGLGEDVTPQDLVAVLWAALRTHHPDVDMDCALDILDELGIQAMQEVLGDAFAAASPDKEGDAGDGAENPSDPGQSTQPSS